MGRASISWDPHLIEEAPSQNAESFYITNDEIDNAQEYCGQLRELIYDGKRTKVSDICETILNRDSQNYGANFYLGLILLDREKHDDIKKAVKFLKEAIKSQPNDHASHVFLGMCNIFLSNEKVNTNQDESDKYAAQALSELKTAMNLKNIDEFVRVAEWRYAIIHEFLLQEKRLHDEDRLYPEVDDFDRLVEFYSAQYIENLKTGDIIDALGTSET